MIEIQLTYPLFFFNCCIVTRVFDPSWLKHFIVWMVTKMWWPIHLFVYWQIGALQLKILVTYVVTKIQSTYPLFYFFSCYITTRVLDWAQPEILVVRVVTKIWWTYAPFFRHYTLTNFWTNCDQKSWSFKWRLKFSRPIHIFFFYSLHCNQGFWPSVTKNLGHSGGDWNSIKICLVFYSIITSRSRFRVNCDWKSWWKGQNNDPSTIMALKTF